MNLLGLIVGTVAISWLGCKFARYLLERWQILDEPGNRSSHYVPIPRGGGIPVLGVTFCGWFILVQFGLGHVAEVCVISALAMILGLVCWFDDIGDLSIQSRLFAQLLAVTIAIFLIPFDPMATGSFGDLWRICATIILWIWFINLFNFMDGIDGMTGVETVAITTGSALIFGFSGSEGDFSSLAIILSAATVGFLFLNWHPAKLFLGDVGSIPLGFLLGWFLINLVVQGEWAAAVILPAYYLTDATLTLCHRAVKLEAVWKPHKSHFYQRAVAGRLSHSQAAIAVAITNTWLVACALLSTFFTLIGLAGALLGVSLLLTYFQIAALNTSSKSNKPQSPLA